MPSAADRVRLRHMLDAGRTALRYVAGRQRADLDDPDEPLGHALMHLLAVLGEAAASVGDDTRAEIPSVPWNEVRAMRNRLIHAYFDVNLDIVWATVQDDLPALVAALDATLRDEQG